MPNEMIKITDEETAQRMLHSAALLSKIDAVWDKIKKRQIPERFVIIDEAWTFSHKEDVIRKGDLNKKGKK